MLLRSLTEVRGRAVIVVPNEISRKAHECGGEKLLEATIVFWGFIPQ